MSDWRCTYRLQLGPGFGFREARELVPYLQELGVSHLYLSPSLQARKGSTHGYDVVDPTRISEDLGGEQAFRELCSAGLGVVLDVVPNHMATSDENPFWRDLLWRAKFFDVDWRTGAYRRFFDVGELAGVRVEDPEVFEVTHRKVLDLVAEGLVDGLRIDHPDGLANPRRYLERLNEAGVEHVWVEKILEPGERLRDWPVDGTTGYEFLNEAVAVFVDPAAEERLTRLYEELTGESRGFHEVAHESKLREASTTFADDVERLAALLPDLEVDLTAALASLPVYRTYVEPDTGRVEDADRGAIEAAALPVELARILLLEERGHDAFVVRFQQTTPPVHAKGVEDTAFYRWNRLLALNEVGGDPARFSVSVEDFHRSNLARLARFPRHLLTTMTHDAKRSADVRARLATLPGFVDEWEALVRARIGGWRDPNEAYLILQTVVGAWPLTRDRLEEYLEKALREAKVHTNWLEPDLEWEAGARAYAVALLADAELAAFAERLAAAAARASLGQVLLKLTSPGVPDIYQGDELELVALVDPDNRRAVDWELRRRLLGAESPPPKLDLIRRALALRARRPESFAGSYEPVDAGPDTVAYTRGGDVLAAVALRGDLSGFTLPEGDWRDVVRTEHHLLAERA